MVLSAMKPAKVAVWKSPSPCGEDWVGGDRESGACGSPPLPNAPPQGGGGNATRYNGNSGSRRALRLAVVAEGEAVERTKLQRTLEACRESCRITIWAVRRGPSFPARNTLLSRFTLLSSASKVQTSRLGSTSITPRASLSRLAFTDG